MRRRDAPNQAGVSPILGFARLIRIAVDHRSNTCFSTLPSADTSLWVLWVLVVDAPRTPPDVHVAGGVLP